MYPNKCTICLHFNTSVKWLVQMCLIYFDRGLDFCPTSGVPTYLENHLEDFLHYNRKVGDSTDAFKRKLQLYVLLITTLCLYYVHLCSLMQSNTTVLP